MTVVLFVKSLLQVDPRSRCRLPGGTELFGECRLCLAEGGMGYCLSMKLAAEAGSGW